MTRCKQIRSTHGAAFFGVVIAGLLLWPGTAAEACRTQVYRYAMYNWPPAPYHVFYFHHGEVAEQDRAVNELLAGMSQSESAPANVLLTVVDLSDEESLKRLPQVVMKARKSHAEGTKPLHLVFSAWGVELLGGRLEADAVEAMVDSPVRRRVAKLLHENHAAVFLILTCPDAAKNRQAEKLVGEVITKVKKGESPFDLLDRSMPDQFMPGPPGNTPQPDDQDDDSPETLKFAAVEVSRTDPAEKWLVRSLLAAEPDLHEFDQEAMVFVVFGRGRTLLPYIGKGINLENLTDCVMFLAGDCSCMIKGANPGVDLLLRWDWDTTAEHLWAIDEEAAGELLGYTEVEVGNPGLMQTSQPEEPAPMETASPDQEPLVEVPPAEVASPDSDRTESAVALSSRALPNTAAPQRNAPQGDALIQEETREVSGSFSAREIWKYGVALAAGAIVVLAAGFVIVRRQRSP